MVRHQHHHLWTCLGQFNHNTNIQVTRDVHCFSHTDHITNSNKLYFASWIVNMSRWQLHMEGGTQIREARVCVLYSSLKSSRCPQEGRRPPVVQSSLSLPDSLSWRFTHTSPFWMGRSSCFCLFSVFQFSQNIVVFMDCSCWSLFFPYCVFILVYFPNDTAS